MNSCYVCCDDVNDFISCCNKNCIHKICFDCLERYIDVCSEDNKSIPSCSMCKSMYIHNYVEKTPLKIRVKYLSLVFAHLKNNREIVEDVEENINRNKMVEKIRNERTEYVKTEVPHNVSTIINWCFKDKMKIINKSKQTYLSNKLNSTRRKCFNILCNAGILIVNEEGNYNCSCCNFTYCVNCEEEKKKDHVCKQEDIDSLNAISKMVKCPKCKLAIEKSQGCNSMRCSSCNTNFDYMTGGEGGHGNGHNKNIDTSSNFLQKITTGDENINRMLENIEKKEPKPYSKQKVIKQLTNCLENRRFSTQELSIEFSNYKYNLIQIREYMKITNKIYELHINNNLTLENLTEIHNKL